MKSLLVALIISVASLSAFAEAEVKRVCHDKTDAKGNVVKKADGSAVQTCKDVKIHKKLEGTDIPEKKK
jgi:hypothetical protein